MYSTDSIFIFSLTFYYQNYGQKEPLLCVFKKNTEVSVLAKKPIMVATIATSF